MARILHIDAAGQGEERVLEQIEAETAGQGQIRVIQRDILPVEHPALFLAPPVEAGREVVDRDRHLEVTGGIHLVVRQRQSGATAGRGKPELAVEILHPGYILPGLETHLAEAATEGETLPVGVGQQRQILHRTLRIGLAQGLAECGVERRDQLTDLGDLVELYAGQIALHPIPDPLQLQAALQPGFAIQLEGDVVAGQLPVGALTAQLDLAAIETETVHLPFLGILPDQVVVAKRQQGIAQLAAVKLAPELEVELTGNLGFARMDLGQGRGDIELAGPQIELTLEAIEPGSRGVHIQNQIDGALTHPVDEVSLAYPLMALATVLPAQLGDVEGAQITEGGGDAEAGIVHIEGGELGQQKAQQGALLGIAGGALVSRLAQVDGDIAIAQDQLAKHRL